MSFAFADPAGSLVRASRVLVPVLLAGAPLPLVAQGMAPAVLSLPGSVRSAGLHGAGAALVGDAGAVFANPVGIATLRHIGLEGTYRRTRFNATAATAALGWRLSQFDLGLGLAYIGGDSVPVAGLTRSEEHTSELQSPTNLV